MPILPHATLPSPSPKGVAFVTGSAQGIGRAIALKLADDGFDVAVNDLPANTELLGVLMAEISAKGRRVLVTIGDVSVEASVQQMISEVVTELGSLDVMIANAGITMLGPLIDTSVEDWDRVFAVNVRGTFLCYKHAAIQMISQKRGGRIIGACSTVGKKGASDAGCYSSTKFAIRGMTQSAAMEYGKHGITVNTYAPGDINTDMYRAFAKYFSEKQGLKDGEWIEQRTSALGHSGTSADVANLVSFLASKDSHYITGQSIVADGGQIFD